MAKLFFTKNEWVALTDKYSDPELAKMFNVHKNAIYERRKRLNIPTKHRLKRHKTYEINEDFFSVIKTEEQAYVLGFFCGDGNVHSKGRSISISVSVHDQEILTKIKKAIDCDVPIRTKSNSRGFSPNGFVAILDLSRKKFVEDLAKLGIKPCKTFSLRYPDIPAHLDKHFLRGLFDADGWIAKYQIGLCGMTPIINDVKDKIRNHFPKSVYTAEKKVGFSTLLISGRSKEIIHWIYRDASIYLARKYDLYIKHWQ